MSRRDPNSAQTLSAFLRGADWAKSGRFTQQDVDEAKLSVFSAVDSPVAPADKGETPTPLKEVILTIDLVTGGSGRKKREIKIVQTAERCNLFLQVRRCLTLTVDVTLFGLKCVKGKLKDESLVFVFVSKEWVASSAASRTR